MTLGDQTQGMPRRCVAHGKQVKLDGVHFADAISEHAAAVLADAVEYAGIPGDEWPDAPRERVEAYLA